LIPVRKPVPNQAQSTEALDRVFAEKLQLEEYSSDDIPQDNNPFRGRSVGSAGPYPQSNVFQPNTERMYNNETSISGLTDHERDELLALRLQYEGGATSSMHSNKGKQREDTDYALALQMHLELIDEGPETVLRDCVVCGDSVPAADLPALMNCNHEPQTCAGCYAGWIASELESKGWKGITCPESSCKQVLEHADVQAYSSAEVFLR
jgi:hypothetical protein